MALKESSEVLREKCVTSADELEALFEAQNDAFEMRFEVSSAVCEML